MWGMITYCDSSIEPSYVESVKLSSEVEWSRATSMNEYERLETGYSNQYIKPNDAESMFNMPAL